MSKFVQKFRKDREYDDDSIRANQRKKARRAERSAATHNKRDFVLEDDSPVPEGRRSYK